MSLPVMMATPTTEMDAAAPVLSKMVGLALEAHRQTKTPALL